MMAAVILRLAMLLAAVAATAVSAVWLHDAHDFSAAQAAAQKARSPADQERAAARFEGVSALGPDTPAKAAEAYALLRAGRPDRAGVLLEDVVRREPRNVRAWVGLYFADRDRNPARAAYARARIRALSPPVGRARR